MNPKKGGGTTIQLYGAVGHETVENPLGFCDRRKEAVEGPLGYRDRPNEPDGASALCGQDQDGHVLHT